LGHNLASYPNKSPELLHGIGKVEDFQREGEDAGTPGYGRRWRVEKEAYWAVVCCEASNWEDGTVEASEGMAEGVIKEETVKACACWA
jgi:hypothetical protein